MLFAEWILGDCIIYKLGAPRYLLEEIKLGNGG